MQNKITNDKSKKCKYIIENILKQHGFIKYKSLYCRIINKCVFQTLGFVNTRGLWLFTFDSINLYVEKINLNNLFLMSKYHLGFNSLNLINYYDEKEYHLKSELINIVSNNIDEIINKLDDLYSLKQHIKYIEKKCFVLYGQSITVPIEFYLYDEQFDKAKKIINEKISYNENWIIDCTIEGIVDKTRYESEDLFREQLYMHIKENEDLLAKINNNTYVMPNFNDIYNKNVLVLNEFFNCDFIKRFE